MGVGSVMAGRPPVPTKLRILRGNPGGHPIRPHPEPPALKTMPDPPEYLTEAAQNEWWRAGAELLDMGILCAADLKVFAAYCAACGTFEEARTELKKLGVKGLTAIGGVGNPIRNPLLAVANEAAKEMVTFASHFGLSPTARARVNAAPKSEPGDKLDSLLA